MGDKKCLAAPCLYLLPGAAAFLAFMFWPLARTIYLSFFEWNMIRPVKKFVFLGNYIALLRDPITLKVLENTFMYIGLLLVINCAAPYVLAFILSHVIKKGKGFYKSAIFLPSVIPLVVGSILYTWILNPISGPAAIIAKSAGISMPVWSKSQGVVVVVLSIITSWKVFGYNFIVVLGGIAGIPHEVVEAARLENVPARRIFFDIILPMSGATGVYVLIITIVQGLQYVFTPIKVITQGGPNYASSNLIYQSYHEAFTIYRTGTASAYAIVTMALFAALLVLEFRFVERGIHYES
jgi:sn-glycerol 3-phosphate transport system permease protein